VSFPDFPAVMVVGETLEHVRAQAEVALLIHIRRRMTEGEEIPEPTDFKEIIADPRHQGAFETMIVTLFEIDLNGDDDGEV
jgi:predicted RNase H-like HicB family nuclease